MGPEQMIFRMKILCYMRSAYERQIHESVLIQQNRHHHILNSKSEYNRCKIPRLTVKMGDAESAEAKQKEREEQKLEDDLENVIKEMKKRSKHRKRPDEDPETLPPRKKQKRAGANINQEDDADIAIDEAIRLCEELEKIHHETKTESEQEKGEKDIEVASQPRNEKIRGDITLVLAHDLTRHNQTLRRVSEQTCETRPDIEGTSPLISEHMRHYERVSELH